jgi:hypothetical protein
MNDIKTAQLQALIQKGHLLLDQAEILIARMKDNAEAAKQQVAA